MTRLVPVTTAATLAAALAITLAATGCGKVNPPIAQLETFKADATNSDFESVATAPLSCAADQAGCAQRHAIKADACHRTAEGAPAPLQRQRLDCAAENYGAALDAVARHPAPEVDTAQAELGMLDSLLRRRDLSAGGAEADAANTALRDAAMKARQGPNANPAGFVYGADAELNAVLRDGRGGGCIGIATASGLLGTAHTSGTRFAQPAARLAAAIRNARKSRRCPS